MPEDYEPLDDECVDKDGYAWPEHDYDEYECRRCRAAAPPEDDTPWLVTDAKIDRYEEEQGL